MSLTKMFEIVNDTAQHTFDEGTELFVRAKGSQEVQQWTVEKEYPTYYLCRVHGIDKLGKHFAYNKCFLKVDMFIGDVKVTTVDELMKTSAGRKLVIAVQNSQGPYFI